METAEYDFSKFKFWLIDDPKRGRGRPRKESPYGSGKRYKTLSSEDWTGKRAITSSKENLRAHIFLELYKKGNTLAEIGAIQTPPISRERVRQLLARIGVTKVDGGGHVMALVRVRYKSKPNRYMPAYGCTRDRAMELNAGLVVSSKNGVAILYGRQRNSANQRGIEWALTFPEWIEIWRESGKAHLRGLGSGKYVMARWGDSGAYSVDNVKIITHNENSRESREMDKILGRFTHRFCAKGKQ